MTGKVRLYLRTSEVIYLGIVADRLDWITLDLAILVSEIHQYFLHLS